MNSGTRGWAGSDRRWPPKSKSAPAYDRVLATRYGLGAIDMVHRAEYGRMAALQGNKIISIPLLDAISTNRKVDKEILDVATGILDKLDFKVSTTA
jgi:6-phosphofructokinase